MRERKLSKEVSLREEIPEVKRCRSITRARRKHSSWALVPEKKWIPNRGGGRRIRGSLEADV